MSIVEKMARATAEKLTDAPWECVCSANLGADCDCGDAMTEDSVDRYDERLTRNLCRRVARAALTATGLTETQLEGLANGTMVVVPGEPTEAMCQNAALQVLFTDWCDLAEDDKVGLLHVYRAMLAAKEG